MRWLGAFSLSLCLSLATPAAAEFYTYSQWQRLPDEMRAAYIAGAFDMLVTFVSQGADTADTKYYSECVTNTHIDNKQLAMNVATFVDARPELQGKSVAFGLIQYLLGLCGQPPQ